MAGVKVTGHLSSGGSHLAMDCVLLCGHLVTLNTHGVLTIFLLMCMYFQ